MECSEKDIPRYLHYSENKKIYHNRYFKFYHLLFRTGFKEKDNPIEFPLVITSFSVCWSKLISAKDVLKTVKENAKNPDGMGNHTFFGRINTINKIIIKENYSDSQYSGEHIVSVAFKHSPVECNYSHSEILIKHQYNDNGERKIETIEYDAWANKKCLIRKKSHKDFFQPIINDYKAKLATSLNSDINELNTKWITRFFPKNLIVRLSFWKATTFNHP